MPRKAWRDPELRETYRCKKGAHWRFTKQKNSMATSGIYCVDHLWTQLYCMDEVERLEKYQKRWKDANSH